MSLLEIIFIISVPMVFIISFVGTMWVCFKIDDLKNKRTKRK